MVRVTSRPLVTFTLSCLCALAGACVSTQEQPQFTISRRPIINGSIDNTDTSVVALVYQGQQFCTGTVIAPQWVLSAGHCLVEMASEVGTGFETHSSIYFGTTVGGSGSSITVTEAHAHPSYYTRSDGAPMYDVSVWKLAAPAPVAAMPWQSTSLTNPSGQTVQLVGYGVTNAQQQTGNGTRREVDAQVSQMDSDFLYYGNGYSGTCQGDSGGPMFLNGVVIGVCSFGDQSCVQEGANTRVDIYASFIQQYVGTSSQPQPVTVSITSPANGSTQSASFAVTASVTSSAGISKAVLSLDGSAALTLTASPYTFNLSNVATGTHQITVTGTGTDGGTGQASISVTVQAQVVTGCSASNPCATGYDCVNGQCVPQSQGGCGTSGPCAAGYQCVSGQCMPALSQGCSAASPCGAGYDCMNGACVAAGTTGASCATNTQCASGICVDGSTGNGYCTQQCATAADCPNQSACVSGSGMNLCGPANSAAPGTGSQELSSGCSAGRGAGAPVGGGLLFLVALGLVLWRRNARVR